MKEERELVHQTGNINVEGNPVRLTGKLFPKKDLYNRFAFARKYQLKHINGLTFDFLFDMAKELEEKDSMMMMTAGPKGKDLLVFQDGGKPYRAFLEGRTKNNGFLLIMHLTNMELKALPKDEE